MYNIPPRTSPIPTFEGFDDFNPFLEGIPEPNFSDLPLWFNGLGNQLVDFPIAAGGIKPALYELDKAESSTANEIAELSKKPKQKNFKAKIVKKFEAVPFMDNDL